MSFINRHSNQDIVMKHELRYYVNHQIGLWIKPFYSYYKVAFLYILFSTLSGYLHYYVFLRGVMS